MTLPSEPPLQKLQFYATTPYPCGYLEGKLAQSLIAAPHHLIDAATYSDLIKLGFRRSGKFAYRPHCEHCKACVPVRLPVAEFKPNRSQRRARKQHANLTAVILPLTFKQEHFALYAAYQVARHNGGDMHEETADQYRNFLVQSNVDSLMIEFRLGDTIKMVSVVDIVEDGVSAVYTFYDAGDKSASYGTYNVLWLIEWCHSLKLPYLYLGYWIAESRKMAYKQNFLPQQGLLEGEWQYLSHPHKQL
ncbi:MAG TPA: arginyltransferase [Methylophilaceae bacterium]|nr:arginyltransferase [Methylophilaceae bacterium]